MDRIPFKREWTRIHAMDEKRLPLCGCGRAVSRIESEVNCEECINKLFAKKWAQKIKETEVCDASRPE